MLASLTSERSVCEAAIDRRGRQPALDHLRPVAEDEPDWPSRVRVTEQPLDGLADGWGDKRHIAAKVLEVGLVGGEGSRVASGEEDVEELVALRRSRRHGTGFGRGSSRGGSGVLMFM